MPDQPGDVEQRGDAEHAVAGGEPEPLAEVAAAVHHRLVGVHRALGMAGGPGRVGQHRNVAWLRGRAARALPGVGGHDAQQVERAAREVIGGPGAAPALTRSSSRACQSSSEVVITVSTRDCPEAMTSRGDRQVQAVQAQERLRAGIGEQVRELAALVHGIDRDRGAAGLPGAEQADDEAGVVLHVKRQPLARPEAAVEQRERERVRGAVELADGELAVEVAQRDLARRPLGRGPEQLQHRAVLRLDAGGLALAVPGKPGPARGMRSPGELAFAC